MRSITDEEAVTSISLGHGKGMAFQVLYERYATRGMGYAYSMLRNEADSEEAVQEAFCRLLNPLSRGGVDSAKGAFCAVFFSTLRNLCIDMLRKERRRRVLPLEKVPEPLARPAHSETAELDLEKKVRAAMEALPSRQCEALKLRLNGDLSYDQIASILECSHGQVRTWIYRARRSLEDTFRKSGLIEESRSMDS